MTATVSGLWSVTLDDAVSVLAARRGGSLLAAASMAGDVLILDTTDGTVISASPSSGDGVLAATWDPSGELLATGGTDGRIRLHRTTDGTETVGTGGWVQAMCYSPDGALLAVGAGRDLLLLDRSGAVVRRYRDQPSTITCLAWSVDGRRVLVGCYGGLRCYEPRDSGEKPIRVLEWKGSPLCVSCSEKWVASGYQDASIHIWRLWSGDDAEMAGYPRKVNQVTFDHSGQRLAATGADDITVWNFAGKGPMGRAPTQLRGLSDPDCLAWEPSAAALVGGDRTGQVAVWTRFRRSRISAEQVWQLDAAVTALAWSDGNPVAGLASGAVNYLPAGAGISADAS